MLTEKLLSKAKEAFIMAIEIYNKPTIKYRVEGFSFFICNAWELMLKAHMIKTLGESSIYYKDNPNRTITLENCLQKVFTNDKDPLRRNLLKIIDLRNTSTHFVTEEYEMVYIPLFQACVLNFVEKMQKFHDVDMTEVVPQNFLTLAISMKALDENTIRAKYPEEIAQNNTHKFTMKNVNKEVNRRLQKAGIDFTMNQYVFGLFNAKYGIKDNEKYCYVHRQYSQPSYTYSMQAIDLITNEILNNPAGIMDYLKDNKTKK